MTFQPEIAPPQDKKTALWFVFFEDRLLLKNEKHNLIVPDSQALIESSLIPPEEVYLGKLNGIPCYAGSLSPKINPPEGWVQQGLRPLYGQLPEELYAVAGYAFQIVTWDGDHRYCGRCGTATVKSGSERAKICPQCGFLSFPRLNPAIIVAITRGDQILLAHGRRFAQPTFSVLAGFVEPGESLEECLRREVMEEVGLSVKNIRYFASQSWPYPHSLMVAFTAEYAGGEIRIQESEIIEAGWFQADTLPPIPARPSIARELIEWFVRKESKRTKLPGLRREP